jgi:hypothetical protein
MKILNRYIKQNKIKNIIFSLFLILLVFNYVYGYRFSIPVIDNLVYKNTYYLLIVLWILVVWLWQLKKKLLIKIGFFLFLFSCFYQLLDKRIVAEILMSYCLLVFLTATIILIIESLRDE